MNRKIIYWSILFVSLLAISFMIYFIVINFKPIKAFATGNFSIYSQSDLDDAYEKGVKKSEKKLEEYTNLISSYKSQISVLEIENETCEKTIKNLELDNQNKQLMIDELTTQLEILTTDFNVVSIENLQLKAEINELQNEIDRLTAIILENEYEITNLQQQVNSLQSDIIHYQELCQTLKPEDMCIVTLNHNGSIYDLIVVEKGDILSNIVNPIDDGSCIFNYWTKNGVKIDDINTEVITEDTTYVSNITKCYFYEFYVEDVLVDSFYVSDIDYFTFPTVLDTESYKFNGRWFKNSFIGSSFSIENSYCPGNVNSHLDENIKFYADLSYYKTINFYDNDNLTLLKSIKCLQGNIIPSSEVPIINRSGYEFLGWKTTATVNYTFFVDLNGFKVKDDINFYAHVNQFYNISFLKDNQQYLTTKYYVDFGLLSYIETPVVSSELFIGYFDIDEQIYIDDVNTYEFTKDTILKYDYRLNIISLPDKVCNPVSDEVVSVHLGINSDTISDCIGYTLSFTYQIVEINGELPTYTVNNYSTKTGYGQFIAGYQFLWIEINSLSITWNLSTNNENELVLFFDFGDDVLDGTKITNFSIQFYY